MALALFEEGNNGSASVTKNLMWVVEVIVTGMSEGYAKPSE